MNTPMTAPATAPLPLADIILPAPMQSWELAYGWWLLIILGCAGIVGLAIWLQLYRRKQQAIKQAQISLLSRTDHLQGNELCAAINEWLKIKARQHWPHAQALHGQAWIEFLNSSAKKPIFVGLDADSLANGPYIPKIWASRVDLQNLALQWFIDSQAYRPAGKNKQAVTRRSVG